MASTDDRALENLIRAAEDLVRNVEVPGGTDPSVLPRAAEEQIQNEAAVPLEAEPSEDGTSIVQVSEDGMEVRAWFHPAIGNGAPLSLEAVTATIELKGVTFGVDWEAVRGCILTCNSERAEVGDVVIARGRAPVPETPPFLVLSDRLAAPERKEGPAGARVDRVETDLLDATGRSLPFMIRS